MNKYTAEYIWITGDGITLCSKTKILDKNILNIEDLPYWNYDGSSTGQATTDNSEVILKPVRICPDPFRRNFGILVLCESYNSINNEPVIGNRRYQAALNKKLYNEDLMFGFEQEYVIMDAETNKPYKWPHYGYPEKQGKYYCGVGGNHAYGREIAEEHLENCLYAGLSLTGINAEVMPSQWEYQLCTYGIDAADQLWLSRYILQRVCEKYNAYVSFNPKPMTGDWNGSGLHTNFSTISMREPYGIKDINLFIKKLENFHTETMKFYGYENEKRMLGSHETASYDKFTYGIANRGASVRIPTDTAKFERGYLEDRRPAANADPYDIVWIFSNLLD